VGGFIRYYLIKTFYNNIMYTFLFVKGEFGDWSSGPCIIVHNDEKSGICSCSQLGHFALLFVSQYY